MKINHKSIFTLLFIILTLAGASCGVRFSNTTADGGVYKSTNGGKQWQQVVFVQQDKKKLITIAGLDIQQLVASPFDAARFYAVGGTGGIFETTNAGDSWHQVFNSPANALIFDPIKKEIAYIASGNKILRTTDIGKNWQAVYLDPTAEVNITTLALNPRNHQVLYAGTSKGGLLKSEDGGTSWQQVYFFKQAVSLIGINATDPKIIYIPQAAGSLWRSPDAGKSWTDITLHLQEQLKITVQAYRALALIATQPDGLLYATQYGLFRSLNGGANWEIVKLLTAPSSTAIATLIIDTAKEKNIYYTTYSTFYKTDDGGISWETLPLPSKRKPSAMIINSKDNKLFYLGFSR